MRPGIHTLPTGRNTLFIKINQKYTDKKRGYIHHEMESLIQQHDPKPGISIL